MSSLKQFNIHGQFIEEGNSNHLNLSLMAKKWRELWNCLSVQCFVCVACGKKLTAGDFFALRDEGLYCNEHHRPCDKGEGGEGGPENNNNKLIQNHNRELSEDGDDKSEEGRRQTASFSSPRA